MKLSTKRIDILIRKILAVYTSIAIIIFIYLPILILIIYSFHVSPYFTVPFQGFSLRWYKALLEIPEIADALWNSIWIATAVTALSLALGIPPGFAIIRWKAKARTAYLIYLMIPFVIPWLLIGVADLIFYIAIGMPLSNLTVILSHVTYSIPLVAVIVSARVFALNPSIEEASMDLGADELTTFKNITLPLLFPAIASAAIITFAWSFDNFIITYFTIGEGYTFPVWVWSVLGRRPKILPVINAVSVLIFTASIIAIYLIIKIGGKESIIF
jgi:spermidine/putrescine transport system permease protein